MADDNVVSVKYQVDITEAKANAKAFEDSLSASLKRITDQLASFTSSTKLANSQLGQLSSTAQSNFALMQNAAQTSLNTITSQLAAIRGASNTTSTAIVQMANQMQQSSAQIVSSLSAMASASASSSSQIINSLNQINDNLSNLKTRANESKSSFLNLGSVISGALGAAGIVGLTAGIKSLIQTESSLEQLEKSFRNIEGSIDAGDKSFSMIKQWAKETPYSLLQAGDVFVRLKNYGITPTKEAMDAFGNAAAKTKDANSTLTTVTTQLGQAWAKNKLQGQDLKLIMESGIPVLDILTNKTGVSAEKLQEMATKGMLGRDAIKLLIEELGRLNAGAMDERMRSFDGQFQIFKDNLLSGVDEIRKAGGLNSLTETFKNLNEWISNLASSGEMKEFAVNFVAATSSMKNALETLLSTSLNVSSGVLGAIQGITTRITSDSKENVSAMDFWAGGVWLAGKYITETLFRLEEGFYHLKSTVLINIEAIGINYNLLRDEIKISTDSIINIVKTLSSFDGFANIGNTVSKEIESSSNKIAQAKRKAFSTFRDIENKEWAELDSLKKDRDKQLKLMYDPTYANEEAMKNAPNPTKKPGAPDVVDLPLKQGKVSHKGEASEYSILMERLSAENLKIQEKYAKAEMFLSEQEKLQNEISFLERNKSLMKYSADKVKIETKINEDTIKLKAMRLSSIFEKLKDEQVANEGNLKKQLEIEGKILSHYKAGTLEWDREHKKRTEIINKQKVENESIQNSIKKQNEQFALEDLEETVSIEKIKLTEHKISKEQYLKDAREFIAKKYQIKRAELAIDEETATPKQKADRNLGLAKINRQEQKEMLALNQSTAKLTMKVWDDAAKTLENSWTSHFDKILARQESFKNAMKGIARDMLQFSLKALTQESAAHAMSKVKEILTARTTEAQLTEIKASGQGARLGVVSAGEAKEIGIKAPSLAFHTGLEFEKVAVTGAAETAKVGIIAAGEAEGLAVKATTTGSSIMMDAWKAMAGAYAALSGIPIIGPVLAPVAAGVAFAGVAGLVSHIASAEGGYDIPAGINPVTQLHEQEMVLPKAQANAVRQMAKDGDSNSSSQEVHHHYNPTFTINAVDAKGVKQFFDEHAKTIARSMQNHARSMA